MKKKNGVMVKSMGAAHFRSPFQSFAGDSEIHQCSACSLKVSVMDCIEPVFSSCVCVCVWRQGRAQVESQMLVPNVELGLCLNHQSVFQDL